MTPHLSSHLLPAVIGVLVFCWILYRQLQPRSVAGGLGRKPLIFGVLGLVFTIQYVAANPVSTPSVAGVLLSLGIAAVLAHFRGVTARIWRSTDGTWLTQGTALTIVLWFVSIGSHLGLDALLGTVDPTEGVGRGLGNASTLLYLGLSLALQGWQVQRRQRALAAGLPRTPVGLAR